MDVRFSECPIPVHQIEGIKSLVYFVKLIRITLKNALKSNLGSLKMKTHLSSDLQLSAGIGALK